MSAEQEHEIVPAIRDWLTATSDVEIPPGLSREEARLHARDLRTAIVAGTVVPDQIEMDDDLKDILWATTKELEEKPHGQPTFEECDRFYQFVAALPLESDAFDERDEILHLVAMIGWRSAPGGLEGVLKTRAAIWEHGDEKRHREVCESAHQLPGQIQALGGFRRPCVSDLQEICTRLIKVSTIRPVLAASSSSALQRILDNSQTGRLDDREHLKGVANLTAGIAARQLSDWKAASSACAAAIAGFRKCADHSDLERVRVEQLGLEFAKGNFHVVCLSAPDLISALTVPRERVKAQLILAWAFLDLKRSREARVLLEAAHREPIMGQEPAIHACVLTVLGCALGYLNRDVEAMTSFKEAKAILTKFSHPAQLACLTSTMGEFFSNRGMVYEASIIYATAREMYRGVGQERWVGYVTLLIAELLILLDRSDDARMELLAALPLIEKAGVWMEAVAGVALLRESVANRRPDVTAIRTLRDQLQKELQR